MNNLITARLITSHRMFFMLRRCGPPTKSPPPKTASVSLCGNHPRENRFNHRFSQYYQNVSKCVNKSFNWGIQHSQSTGYNSVHSQSILLFSSVTVYSCFKALIKFEIQARPRRVVEYQSMSINPNDADTLFAVYHPR